MSESPGAEWIVDAYGCDAERLRSRPALEALFDRVIRELALQPLTPPEWHVFPGPGGITGFVLLRESHLACHTFPEHGYAAFNLYCCRPRHPWDWRAALVTEIGATDVEIRTLARGRVPVGLVKTSRSC